LAFLSLLRILGVHGGQHRQLGSFHEDIRKCPAPRIAVLVVAAALLAVPLDGTGLAQSQFNAAAKGQRLDELFGRLKAVNDEREGKAAVAQIWKLWLQSGRPELDESMERADLTEAVVCT
jgi:hypothetical protein